MSENKENENLGSIRITKGVKSNDVNRGKLSIKITAKGIQ